jgi:hypothetical protein
VAFQQGFHWFTSGCRIVLVGREWFSSAIYRNAELGDKMETRECSRCHLTKPINEFCKDKRIKCGYARRCKDCNAEYYKNYYNKNKDKLIKRSSDDYYGNKEKKLEYVKSWQLNNKDKRTVYTKKYRDNNKEKCSLAIKAWKGSHKANACISAANRRAALAKAQGTIDKAEWENMLLFYGNTCLCCGRNDVKLTIDHIVPVSLGGSNLNDD